MKIRIEAATRYMDDGRAAIHPFHHGWRWSEKENSVKFRNKWREEDKDLSYIEVTKRILHGTMTGIESFLEFTMETEEEFDGWLPTLDTNIRVEERTNIILYKFFEKPMSANTVLHVHTAMPEDGKIRCLSNDLTRRMLTTSERVDDETRRDIVDKYAQKLLNSGYSIEATRKIVIAGLKGYEKKLKNSRKPGGKLLRSAKESSSGRARKKLLERSEWFKDKEKKRQREDSSDEDEDLPDGWNKDENLPKEWISSKRRKTAENKDPGMGKSVYDLKLLKMVPSTSNGGDDSKNESKTRTCQMDGKKNKKIQIKTRSLLFVRGTKGGKLAKDLRKVMERVKVIVGFNAKVVEKSGQKLRNLQKTKHHL